VSLSYFIFTLFDEAVSKPDILNGWIIIRKDVKGTSHGILSLTRVYWATGLQSPDFYLCIRSALRPIQPAILCVPFSPVKWPRHEVDHPNIVLKAKREWSFTSSYMIIAVVN
jgi:hypothetical protein